MRLELLVMVPMVCYAASVPLDVSGVRPGPIAVERGTDSVTIRWPDEASRRWEAHFSLASFDAEADPEDPLPLITAIAVEGKNIIQDVVPLYWADTGRRAATGQRPDRDGWDSFHDVPNNHPDGTRRFRGKFQPRSARVRTVGNRVEVFFDGLKMGVFEGGIAYTFYPGSRLVQQEAVMATNEPYTAYYYDTGILIAAESDRRLGRRNMETEFAYFDTEGRLKSEAVEGCPDRVPLTVRHRTLAVRTAEGAVAVMPRPHQYFYARDYTTNQGYVWHNTWDGLVSLGVRQLPDDNSSSNPWFNAPPGTQQRMGVFFLLSDRTSEAVLKDVLAYTNGDRFPNVEGYKTLTAHWHFAYTVQGMVKGFDWVPPFKPIFKDMGVNAVMLMDFHGDGHDDDLTDPGDLPKLRLQELNAYFRATRAKSDSDFLLIPSEEANVHLGGHWGLVFPKPVYWLKTRPPGAEFRSTHSQYGVVYEIANSAELLDMVRREGGYMYQAHPRIKSSHGYPDKIRETEYFRDPRHLGGGWKAHPIDLSSPRLGERAFKLLDDMNNWGLSKKVLGEVDAFQIDHTHEVHEVYAHMNECELRPS